MKANILQGARDGGITAGGYPVLNAYKALHRRTKNAGAPLCGNPVLEIDDTIFVDRSDSLTRMAAIYVNGDTIDEDLISPAHGGPTVYFDKGGFGGLTYLAIAYNPASDSGRS